MKKLILYILLCSHPFLFPHQKAVICVPIADLVGQPIHTIYPEQPSDDSYNSLPVCGEKNIGYACPRLHQLLYNDVVEIIATKNDETCINISNIFYITPTSSTPHTTYWTATKNLCLLKDLSHNHTHIPEPIDFNDPQQHTHVITLTQPHYDEATHLTFSAGTRFVCTHKLKKYTPKKIMVFAINYAHNKEISISLPSHKCYINKNSTPTEQINQFVQLLKSWANQENSFIPYVWGGTSFTATINSPFKEIIKETNNNIYSLYQFDDDQIDIKNGFDCSGLIARAAHICNMPYFFKNTTTIGTYLQPLTREDTLINGDLILIKGHVMVVSDADKNLLIEARSYGHGYGKVHEIELGKVFDSMNTYNDLIDAFFHKKELKRKDIWGNVRDTFSDWKILKIMSIYK